MTEHEQVLQTDLNNLEIRGKNYVTGGAYTPYAPCMSTPLQTGHSMGPWWSNMTARAGYANPP